MKTRVTYHRNSAQKEQKVNCEKNFAINSWPLDSWTFSRRKASRLFLMMGLCELALAVALLAANPFEVAPWLLFAACCCCWCCCANDWACCCCCCCISLPKIISLIEKSIHVKNFLQIKFLIVCGAVYLCN